MLKISPLEVVFTDFKNHNLKLQNEQKDSIIFKIRCTNPNIISMVPNQGFLKSNTELSILISASSSHQLDQKMQIAYATIKWQPLNFEECWKQLESTSIQTIIIPVLRNLQKKSQSVLNTKSKRLKKSNTTYSDYQTTKSQQKMLPLLERKLTAKSQRIKNLIMPEIQEFEEQSNNNDSMIRSTYRQQSQTQSILFSNFEKQLKKHIDTEEMQQLKIKIQQLEKKLENQKTKSIKQIQQIKIIGERLKEAAEDQARQKLKSSIGVICEEHHSSFSSLVILSLIFFIVGFSFSQFI